MNWYHNFIISSFFKQASVEDLVSTLQNWGIAKNKTPQEISDALQQLKEIEQQNLAAGNLANDNWLRKQFRDLLFSQVPQVQQQVPQVQQQVPQVQQQVPQQQISEGERKQRELINLANKINNKYSEWVLQVMKSESRTDFDQSVFDYFKAKKVDPLNPPLSYQQAKQGSEQYHQQFYEQKELARYKTPVTAGERVGNMFMVEVTEEDEKAEGINMQNCIGDSCLVSETNRIYSLRDGNNNPHVSIEIEDGTVSQIKGKQNESPNLSYSEYVVEWLSKYPDIKLGNLDNMPVSDNSLAKLEDRFDANGLLIVASSSGSMQFAQRAIESGAKDFNNAMQAAALNGHKEIVELMIQNEATDFNTAMRGAAQGGHKEIVKLMIQSGAKDFNTAMQDAAQGGHKEIVKLMIQSGAKDFNNAMRDAALNGHKEIVELMIQNEATNFNDAMRDAALNGHKEIVELMIQNEATDFNWAMRYAARNGHKEIVELMIQKGAKGATDFNKAMQDAARNGHKEIVELMIQNEATDFYTAMEEAVQGGHKEIVELLIESGAKDLNTAMRDAANNGRKEIVELLIESGATDFNNAMQDANFNGHYEIVKILEEAKENYRWQNS